MNYQTYLTENPPMILDATCSTRKIWPRFASLRMDIRRDVKPDICASATHLPFRDGSISEIYCDPPHMIIPNFGPDYVAGRLTKHTKRPRAVWDNGRRHFRPVVGELPRAFDLLRFGAWSSRSEWEGFVKQTNEEFMRCLSPNGTLHYKITHGTDKRMTKIEDMVQYTNFTEMLRKELKSRAPWSKNLTYFLTMRPKP